MLQVNLWWKDVASEVAEKVLKREIPQDAVAEIQEDLGIHQLSSGQNQLTSYQPTAQSKQDSQFSPPQPATCAAGGATALLSPLPVKNNSSNHNSEKEAQIGEKRHNCSQQGNLDLAWLAENPAFLAACYCLALLHQLGGLDFLSLLGMVLAMTSMVSMFFL